MSYPRPIIHLPFGNAKQLCHPAVSFARASIGSYFDSTGLPQYARAGVPRFDHDPLTGICKGLLIEPAVTFLDTFDSQFDNAAWSKYKTTITRNAIAANDGAVADKLVEDSTASSYHYANRPTSIVAGSTITSQWIISSGERCYASLYLVNTDYTVVIHGLVNLLTGTIEVSASGNPVSYSGTIEALLNGRYKVTLSCILDSTSTTAISQINLQSVYGNDAYSGDGVSGLYIWKWKIAATSSVGSSIPTGWETTSTTQHSIVSTALTFTVADSSTTPGKAIPAGAVVKIWQTSVPTNYMTGTVTSHSGTTLIVSTSATGGSGTNITDWTIQAGASVTRSYDFPVVGFSSLLDMNGNSLWGGTEGTVVVAARSPFGSSNQSIVDLNDGTYNNRLSIFRNSGLMSTRMWSGGTDTGTKTYDAIPDNSDFIVAVTFDKTDISVCISNGSTATKSLSLTALPPFTRMIIGGSAASVGSWGSTIKWVSLYNRKLTAYLPALVA